MFTIRTPNLQFDGQREGITFVLGVAHTSDETVRNILVNDYGYSASCEDSSPGEVAEVKPARQRKSSGK